MGALIPIGAVRVRLVFFRIHPLIFGGANLTWVKLASTLRPLIFKAPHFMKHF